MLVTLLFLSWHRSAETQCRSHRWWWWWYGREPRVPLRARLLGKRLTFLTAKELWRFYCTSQSSLVPRPFSTCYKISLPSKAVLIKANSLELLCLRGHLKFHQLVESEKNSRIANKESSLIMMFLPWLDSRISANEITEQNTGEYQIDTYQPSL